MRVIDVDVAQMTLSTLAALLGALGTGIGFGALALLTTVRRLRREAANRDALAEKMADSEELYRTTVNSLVDGVVIQEEDGTVVQINDAARRIIAEHSEGATLSDGQNFAEFLPHILNEEGRPMPFDERPVRRALSGPDPVVGVIVGLPRTDGVTWFRCNATAAAPRPNRARRVVLTIANITAERAMATELSDQERRFRLALEHAPIGMALVAMDGAFLTVNNALCQLTGRTHDELHSCGLFGLAHPDQPYGRHDLESLVSAGGDTMSAVGRIASVDGTTINVRIAVAVIRPDAGTEPHFIFEFLDITETLSAANAQQLALEREQQAVAELIALDDARSTFLSTVSHELRTPLTSMIGYLEMLDDETAGTLSNQQHQMIDAAVRNGERLGRLIDDLLAMTAAEQEEVRTRTERVDVSNLVADVMTAMAPLADHGGLSLRSSLDESSASVIGDRSELERVLLNVVGNAVKFTPEGGSVHLTTTCLLEPNPSVAIAIVDTGPGIPAHEHEQLFTRFFRSDEARRNHVPGTGLGLAIASKLVDAHNGQIELDSVELEGTTVTIRLPLATPLVG